MPIRLSLAVAAVAADLVVRILDKQAVPADLARDVAEHLVETARTGEAT